MSIQPNWIFVSALIAGIFVTMQSVHVEAQQQEACQALCGRGSSLVGRSRPEYSNPPDLQSRFVNIQAVLDKVVKERSDYEKNADEYKKNSYDPYYSTLSKPKIEPRIRIYPGYVEPTLPPSPPPPPYVPPPPPPCTTLLCPRYP